MQRNNRKIFFFDTTLREGEQMAGVCFCKDNKKSIANLLLKAGVSRVELGILTLETELINELDKKVLKNSNLTILISPNDIKKASEIGVREVNVLIPTNERFGKAMMNKTMDEIRKMTLSLLEFAEKFSINVNLVLADASRTPFKNLLKLLKGFLSRRCNIIIYSDTVGIMTPLQSFGVVRKLKKNLPEECKIGVHFHNDFGLATANTLAAIEAGADYPTTSINGYGERNGIADLCEVAFGCEYLLKIKTGIDFKIALSLSSMLQKFTGVMVSPLSPLKGILLYKYESGVPIQMIKKDGDVFEPIPPEIIGRERRFVYGKLSGSKVLKDTFTKLGFKLKDEELMKLRLFINMASLKKMTITAQHASSIIESYEKVIDTLGLTEQELTTILRENIDNEC
ncbi:MAG: LeuA family protein [bacterium]